MGAHRVFIAKENICGGRACIIGEDAKHIATVLRLKTGDGILVCDGENGQYSASIIGGEKGEIELALGEHALLETEPCISVTIYQALPKPDKMDLIIQKCVELGAYALVPVQTERSVPRLESSSGAKLERWRKIAREAARQSGRGIIPHVWPPLLFAEMREKAASHDIFLAAYENEENNMLAEVIARKRDAKDIGVFIGPEGGIAPQEADALRSMGAFCVSLGRRTLRTETAGMAVLAMLMYECGEMGCRY